MLADWLNIRWKDYAYFIKKNTQQNIPYAKWKFYCGIFLFII